VASHARLAVALVALAAVVAALGPALALVPHQCAARCAVLPISLRRATNAH
jgi:hypothetical protein